MENKPGINLANGADIAVGWGIKPPVLGSQPWRNSPLQSKSLSQILTLDVAQRRQLLTSFMTSLKWLMRMCQFSLCSAPHVVCDHPGRAQTTVRFFCKAQSSPGSTQTQTGSQTALPSPNGLISAMPQICSSNPTHREQGSSHSL